MKEYEREKEAKTARKRSKQGDTREEKDGYLFQKGFGEGIFTSVALAAQVAFVAMATGKHEQKKKKNM